MLIILLLMSRVGDLEQLTLALAHMGSVRLTLARRWHQQEQIGEQTQSHSLDGVRGMPMVVTVVGKVLITHGLSRAGVNQHACTRCRFAEQLV